jgi:hypothetical protein
MVLFGSALGPATAIQLENQCYPLPCNWNSVICLVGICNGFVRMWDGDLAAFIGKDTGEELRRNQGRGPKQSRFI